MVTPKLIKTLLTQPIVHNTVLPFLRAPGVRVLMYHRIGRLSGEFEGLDIDVFRDHVAWLASRYTPIRPHELTDPRYQTRSKRPAVLLTFDDGYTDFYTNAYPILREYNVPALVFLPTEAVSDGGTIWPERLQCWIDRARAAGAYGALADLFKPQYGDLIIKNRQVLKSMPDDERRVILDTIRTTLDSLGVDTHIDRQMMTWSQINSTRPFIEYGAHTHTHPIVARMSPAEFKADMQRNCEHLERGLGERPTTFAWPNGRWEDFSESALDTVKSFGFTQIFTTVEGVNRQHFNPYEIRRLPTITPDATSLNALMTRAS